MDYGTNVDAFNSMHSTFVPGIIATVHRQSHVYCIIILITADVDVAHVCVPHTHTYDTCIIHVPHCTIVHTCTCM